MFEQRFSLKLMLGIKEYHETRRFARREEEVDNMWSLPLLATIVALGVVQGEDEESFALVGRKIYNLLGILPALKKLQ